MKKKLLFTITIIALLLFSNKSFSQAANGTLNLGILTSFEAYTGAGAISNGAGASVNGDVGTNIGIISGFGLPPTYTGNTYNANDVTAQCKFDLFRTYIHLNDLFVDYPGTHAPAFGGGETITPGVYSTGGAGSLGGTLTLDGKGNPNAFFVIKFYGAFTIGAGAEVKLTGGTQSCNVFWIAEGAISVAANANVKGTLFAKIGAVGLGADVVLEGRMFSIAGAITTGVNAVASPPAGISTIPIFCETDCSPAAAVDVLGVLSNFALYTSLGAVANTSISGIDGNIGSDSGAISGYGDSVTIGSFNSTDTLTAQAKIDVDNAYTALMALPNTVLSHPAVFGALLPNGIGETVTPGVYFIAGAGSIGGTVTLDAQNNPDAIFVFKFAGALSIGAQSKIILINGARRCNVFWIGGAGVATGAVNIGAGSVLKGTFFSHGGACNSGADVFLAGRQLSTGGAVNTYTGIIYNNPVCVTSKSLGAPVIIAVAETAAAVNESTGGTTTALTSNDTYNGTAVVIGTAPGNVTLSGITVPTGLTLNLNGTVTIAPNTLAGNYNVTYKICEFSNLKNCSSITSTIVVSATPAAPTVALVKTAIVSGTGIIGDVITYTFTVTNTGNTTLTNVVITDPMIGLTLTGNPIVSLAKGASSSSIKGTHIITQADIDVGKVTNSATVTAKDPQGNNITDVSGTSNDDNNPTVITFNQNPSVALVKTANLSGSGILGDKINYIFSVTNTGNTTLTNVVVTDPLVGLTIIGIPIASLAPGKVAVAMATYIITKENIDTGKVTNSATVTTKDPNGNDVTDVSGTSIDDNDPTVTLTPILTAPIADFTPTIDIDSVVFLITAPKKDFVVNISEIGGAPSVGQVIVKIQKLSAFTITYGAATSTANVSGGVAVNNNNWIITENSSFITMTLKTGSIIGKNTFSAIGFSLTLKSDVPTQTVQSITTTIVNGSGSDGLANNNTTNTIVKAQ
ncbi:conserved repeat domain-containing protein [Flavobacterium segetis]|uniref:Conserved repeat domain-containing protein n=1 Tax=Flavobacterium segetis TaxID=271157 RepID=A0A1M5IQF3_9FLAO|nr:ice-binding family protein [Flavobacterium segetis]SHG30532.1 conserved repeat domain-containing protein [Flavobacterium segetis]